MRSFILSFIDPFYPLFKRFLNIQTFRYAVCGTANMGFDIFLYFLFYNFILDKKVIQFSYFAVSPHIASFFMAFAFSFPSGFLLMKTVVFPNSTIGGRVQLMRYFSVVMLNILMNYLLLKLLVDVLKFYPTPSKIIITCVIVTVTFLLQKYFTFKGSSHVPAEEEETLEV